MPELTYGEVQEAIVMREIKSRALKLIPDLVSSFLYYDRKEDEDLSVQEIESVLRTQGFIEDCVKEFEISLMNAQ